MELSKLSEYAAYKILEHWKQINIIVLPEKVVNPKNKLFPLFKYIYHLTRNVYKDLPLRKNGEDPFIHPINVIWGLKGAKVKDPIVLCVGLTHDFVEEKVDLYKVKKNIVEDKKGIKKLDNYELKVFNNLSKDLVKFCKNNNIEAEVVEKIINATQLLTRHKRDFYYQSICNIYESKDEETKERAILVKLADRMHNILCIECFNEQERIYQCFKNLFILNSTKKYLFSHQRGSGVYQKLKDNSAMELLFKRCAKATYDSFLTICRLCSARGITNVQSMLHLAFKKFAIEKEAMSEVTKVEDEERHLMRLFQGIIRKYDARLMHRWKEFRELKEDEKRYGSLFFEDFNYNYEQIQAIIDYKDAYALKEAISYLLYLPDYTIAGFEYENLFREKK